MRHVLAAAATLILIIGSAGGAQAKQCRDAHGKFIKCPTTLSAPARCKDKKTGKFAKCGAPGAVPIH